MQNWKTYILSFALFLGIHTITQAQYYSWDWGLALTGKAMRVNDVTGDEEGNIYAAGEFRDEFIGTTDTFPYKEAIHAFVAKVNAKGQLQWVRFVESDLGITFRSVTYANGSVYCGLICSNSTVLIGKDSVIIGNRHNSFLLGYDGNGNLIQYTRIGGLGNVIQDMATDTDGNIHAVGWGGTDLLVNGDTIPNPSVGAFVLKFTPNLDLIWGTTFDGDDDAGIIQHCSVDKDGNMTGVLEKFGRIVLGTDTLAPQLSPSGDAIVQLNANGEYQWIYFLEATTDDDKFITGVTHDPFGNIYFTGSFRGELQLGDSMHVAQSQDLFLISLSPNGELRWGKTFPCPKKQLPGSIRGVSNGLYLNGSYLTYLRLNDSLLVNDGTHAEVFMAKFDYQGNFQWLHTFNETGTGSISEFIQVGNKIKIGGFFGDDWRLGKDTLLGQPAPVASNYFAQFTDSSIQLTPPPPPPPFVEAIFPNPATNTLNIQLTLPHPGPLEARIFDPAGRLVRQLTWPNLPEGPQKLTLDQLQLPHGLYFLKLQATGLETTSRLLIQR